MILYKSQSKNKFKRIIENTSVREVSFFVISVLFFALLFLNADLLRASVSREDNISFSKYSGFYDKSITLNLKSLRFGDDIRYTTDGTDPVVDSMLYTEPIQIDKTTVIKAALYHNNKIAGGVMTQTYFINEFFTLPVISLVTEPENLWDPDIGIYTEGVKDENSDEKFIANYDQRGDEWHHPAYMEFYSDKGKIQFAIDGDIKIHGNTTRQFPQKTLRFCAGGGTHIEYKLFSDSETDKFKCVLLRNSGNDWKDTLFRDALVQNLMAETNLDIQHYQPSIVFLNGEYWGIHNIREFYDEYYFQNKYSLDRDGVVIIFPDRAQGGYPVVEEGLLGDELPYLNMLEFIGSNDMTLSENYEHIKTQMDIDNYIDYMILNIYSNNSDWGDSNLKMWRYKNDTPDYKDSHIPYGVDGKWRWIVYDTDEGMNSPSGSTNTLEAAIRPQGEMPSWATFLFKNLLISPEFKEAFIRRYLYHYNYTYRPERIISLVDTYEARLSPEIERHTKKWGGKTAKGSWVTFKNIEEWQQRVQVIRDFAYNRRQYALVHLSDQLKHGGTANLTVKIPDGGGTVQIDDLKISETEWEGNFFKNMGYSLKADSKFGYTFAGWKSNIKVQDPNELRLHYHDDVELVASFERNLVGRIFSSIGIKL